MSEEQKRERDVRVLALLKKKKRKKRAPRKRAPKKKEG